MRAFALPSALSPAAGLERQTLIERGGSAIIAPNGRYLTGPVLDEEAILHATLNLHEIEQESMTIDVSGHY